VLPLVSVMVVTKSWVTPLVTVPVLSPFDKATEIEAGGQVEKYPAEEPDPANVAVMDVVPGKAAVMMFVVLSIEAMAELPTVKVGVPIEEVQAGIELLDVMLLGNGQASVAVEDEVMEDGAHRSAFEVVPLTVWL